MRVMLPSVAVALAMAAGPLLANDMPKRKSGLWEITTSSAAMQGKSMSAQTCVDGATDDISRASRQSAAEQKCSKIDIRREGAQRVVTETVCKLDKSTATTRGVFTGDFSSSYKAEISTRYDPPLMGRGEDKITMQARWVGPCKPGMKPGDMVLPGGMVVPGATLPQSAVKK